MSSIVLLVLCLVLFMFSVAMIAYRSVGDGLPPVVVGMATIDRRWASRPPKVYAAWVYVLLAALSQLVVSPHLLTPPTPTDPEQVPVVLPWLEYELAAVWSAFVIVAWRRARALTR